MRIPYLLRLVAATGAAVLMAAPVAAEPAYPPSPTLTVKPAMLAGCGTALIEGTGYGPGEVVEVTVVTDPAAARVTSAQDGQTVRANREGSFGLSLELPNVGGRTITATGADSGLSAAAVATVVPPACKSVPVTERISGQMLWAAAVAVASGTVLVAIGTVLWRRRRHQRTSP